MRRFFIYAMPRSGSAWLANFLTYSGSFCQHEPLAGGSFRFSDYPVSGAVDTGAAFIGYEPPDGTLIFHLSRNVTDVAKSLRAIGLEPYDFANYWTGGFQYERLFDIGYLRELWIEVTRFPFDRERTLALMRMNVQTDLNQLRTLLWRGLQRQ